MPFAILLDLKKLAESKAPRLAGAALAEAGPASFDSFAAVVGPLSIGDGKLVFPSAHHLDAPALVLGWWLDVAQVLFEKRRDQGIFGFAGGPFEIRITVEGRAWLLDLCERGKRRTSKTPRVKTQPRACAEALVLAAGKVLLAAKKKKLSAPELDVLAANRKALQAALR